MTFVTYAKIPNDIDVDKLFENTRKAFPSILNQDYLDDIFSRKNKGSIGESLAALLLLADVIKKARLDSSVFIFKRNKNGKPYFDNLNLYFSVSHSRGYVAVAMSDVSEIGVDIETSDVSLDKAQRLAKRFFNNYELDEFEADPENFLRIWTKKEAYCKMLGITLSELILRDKAQNRDDREKQESAFFSFFEAAGHPLTLCLKKTALNINFFESSLI